MSCKQKTVSNFAASTWDYAISLLVLYNLKLFDEQLIKNESGGSSWLPDWHGGCGHGANDVVDESWCCSLAARWLAAVSRGGRSGRKGSKVPGRRFVRRYSVASVSGASGVDPWDQCQRRRLTVARPRWKSAYRASKASLTRPDEPTIMHY